MHFLRSFTPFPSLQRRPAMLTRPYDHHDDPADRRIPDPPVPWCPVKRRSESIQRPKVELPALTRSEAEEAVTRFNARFILGERVALRDGNKAHDVIVRTRAFLDHLGQPVTFLEGVSGAVRVELVEVL